MMEFLQIAREAVEARRKLLDDFAAAYQGLSMAAGYHGYIALEKELISEESDRTIATGLRNIAGTKVPALELEEAGKTVKSYSLIDTSARVDEASWLFQRCLEDIVVLAELQSSLETLGREINRTKRISNALQYLIIPSLKMTIKYLYMKFEEREREEKSRLKRVKVLLEQK
jgi:V/A-type H+-transporting ATPase subunit D